MYINIQKNRWRKWRLNSPPTETCDFWVHRLLSTSEISLHFRHQLILTFTYTCAHTCSTYIHACIHVGTHVACSMQCTTRYLCCTGQCVHVLSARAQRWTFILRTIQIWPRTCKSTCRKVYPHSCMYYNMYHIHTYMHACRIGSTRKSTNIQDFYP